MDFGLVLQPKTRNAKKALLLPYAETNEYRPVDVEIARTLQLQQLHPKGLNGLSTTLNTALTERRRYEKAPPQQPDGLRMRYHPFGVTEYSSDESQPEKQTHVPKFRRPLGIEIPPPIQMQKGESIDVEMHDAPEQPRSKHKKLRNSVNIQTHNGSSEESPPPKHDNRIRDSIDRETRGTGRKDVEMTLGSSQPLSSQRLKRKNKRPANSKLEIDAPAAIDSEIDVELSGTERKRMMNRHTRSESSQPAGEQRQNYTGATKDDQYLYQTPSGTIDLAKPSSDGKKQKKTKQETRHRSRR